MNIEHLIKDSVEEMVREVPYRPHLADDAIHRARRAQRTTRATVAGCAAVALGGGAVLASNTSWPGQQPNASLAQPASSSANEASGIQAAPSSRMLSESKLAAAFQTCRAGLEEYYRGWQPIFGITIDADVDARTPTTWVASRHGNDYRADCALNEDGQPLARGGHYGAKSTPALLYAPVDGQEGDGVGRYVKPVTLVTVQPENGPEQQAVLHGGFWFYPTPMAGELREAIAERAKAQQKPETPALPDNGLIGVPHGYTIRGYDTNSELVYSSTEDGPSTEDCYADPTGTEIVGNGAGATDPSECVRTHEWTPLL